MDTFKIVHIAAEIAVVGAVFVILKKKSDTVQAKCDALETRVEKLEKIIQELMESNQRLVDSQKSTMQALRIMNSNIEEKKIPKKKQKGAGVFPSDNEEEQEKEEDGYKTLEEEGEEIVDVPDYRMGSTDSSSID